MDGFKCVNGRKRFILVDTFGWAIKLAVVPANTSDQEGAKLLLGTPDERYSRLEVIWADQGFRSDELAKWVQQTVGAKLVFTGRATAGYWMSPADAHPEPEAPLHTMRWVVERTFAWFGRDRRLARDYEYLPMSVEAFCYLAIARLILKRLTQ